MALINCPECSKEISDKATACPHCGCPINNQKSMLLDSDYGTCSDCGEALENDKKFCSKCGVMQVSKASRFVSVNQPNQPKQPSKTKTGGGFKKWAWVGFILFVLYSIAVPQFESYKEKARQATHSTSVTSEAPSLSTTSTPDFESDLENRCKDWLFYRNRAYKLGREGDQKGAEQARRAMNQYYNDLSLLFSEKQISDEIARLEAAGYKGGF